MSEARKPARETYDAVVDLATTAGMPSHAVALVKFTYELGTAARMVGGRRVRTWQFAAAEPLLHDFRDEKAEPRLRPGTDFWHEKEATDFVVLGEAIAPGGRPVARMNVTVEVGKAQKKIAVMGRRVVRWTADGKPRASDPEPFTEMPVTWANAYGGVDPRVPVAGADDAAVQMLLLVDHPGLYPRNPFGKGYLVVPGPPGVDIELPNLEDPGDPLTDARLVTGDPTRWYEQPLPWSLDWVHPMMFPRYVFIDPPADAWYPGPDDDAMPEVRRGYLIKGYRGKPPARESGGHPWFRQEASHGLVLRDPTGDEPVTIAGMHPDEPSLALSLSVMKDVSIDLVIEGERLKPKPRLHSVVIRPGEERMNLVFGVTMKLPRVFVPGIHKHIPIAVSVNGDAPVPYEAPPTLKEQLARAAAEKTS